MASSITSSAGVTIVIDTDETSTGETRIRYKNDFYPYDPYIWERFVPGDWVLKDSNIDTVGTQPLTRAGQWMQTLNVGDVYDVVMFNSPDYDPNATLEDPPPDARVTVVALKEGPEATNLLDNEEHGIGGTWFKWYPNTTEDVFAVLQVSDTAPVQDSSGQWSFRGGAKYGTSVADGFKSSWPSRELYVETLRPGNDYFALLRLTTPSGDWQYILGPPDGGGPLPDVPVTFKSRLRTVTVTYKVIHIVNDGADGENKANFKVWLFDGELEQLDFQQLPWRPISDRPSPGEESKEWIAIGAPPISWPPVVIGPMSVPHSASFDGFYVLTRGLAKDSLGSDDPAGNYYPGGPTGVPGTPFTKARNPYPIGMNRETIPEDEPESFDVDAEPLDEDNEFSYNVEIEYSVTYST